MHSVNCPKRGEETQRSERSQSAATSSTRRLPLKRTAKRFARLAIALMALALATPFMSEPAQARRMCDERGKILEALEQNHKETVRAIGIAEDGGLLEVLVSPGGGWTILVTYPQRPTCVVATGQDWTSRFLKIGQPT